jgi:small nuclear ribonucleoprotein (snRNP)-like protein
MTLEEVLNENVSIELKNKTIKRIELLDKATNIIIKLISKIEGEQNDIKRIPTKNT